MTIVGLFAGAAGIVGCAASIAVVAAGFVLMGLPAWLGALLAIALLIVLCVALWISVRPVKINPPPPPFVHPKRNALD